MLSTVLRDLLLDQSCTHTCVKAVKAKALFLVGNAYAATAHVPFCVAGLVHNLIPFLDQAFIEEILKVLKSGIYVPFYLLPGLVKVLLELLATGTSVHVKSFLLQLECVESDLCNFLFFAEIALAYNRLEEPYMHDCKLGVAAGVLGELFLDLTQCGNCGGRGFLI